MVTELMEAQQRGMERDSSIGERHMSLGDVFDVCAWHRVVPEGN